MKAKNLNEGEKFGKLTVVSFSRSENGHRYYLCSCECGNNKKVRIDHLVSGKILSCGCWRKEQSSKTGKLKLKHGKCQTRLYGVLRDMKTRCYNKNSRDFERYGKRGITICDEWLNDFTSFEKWAKENGYDEFAPKMQCTIDRIDNDKGYYPENCRFVTVTEQNKNKTYKKSRYGKEWLNKIKPFAHLKRAVIAEKLGLKEWEVKYILSYYHTTLKELQQETQAEMEVPIDDGR